MCITNLSQLDLRQAFDEKLYIFLKKVQNLKKTI